MARSNRKAFIVVGVSASSGSPTALHWAADEARRRRCDLVAVRAWRAPRPPSAPGNRPSGITRDVDADFAEAEAKLRADVATALGEENAVRCVLVKGSPVTVLLKESTEALMLVLDAPRKADIKAMTLLAHRLVYKVDCPVVVMPPSLTKPGPGKVAKASKKLGTKLARAASAAGRPGVRFSPPVG